MSDRPDPDTPPQPVRLAAASPALHTLARNAYPATQIPMRLVAQPTEAWLRLPCFKLVLFDEGRGVIAVGNTRVPIAGPTLVCLNHNESAAVPTSLGSRAVLFLPEVINEAASIAALEAESLGHLAVSGQLDYYWAEAFVVRDDKPARVFDLRPHAARCLNDRFDRIAHELERQECRFWASWARSFLIECLFLVAQLHHAPLRDTDRPTIDPDHPAAPVVLFLLTRYGDRITLASLAREFRTNKTTLQQQFREHTGKSIAAFLREQRLGVARSLLVETALPIEQIAAHTGFADVAAFGRSFRRAHGMGPGHYRRLRQAPPLPH